MCQIGKKIDRELPCIIFLSLAFLIQFIAYSTAGQSAQIVLEDAKKESNGTFQGSGSVSLALTYGSFALSNWFAPPLLALIAPNYLMVLGSTAYALYVGGFLQPAEWYLYLSAILVGFGAAILWSANSVFITNCSRKQNIQRNFTIFWSIYQLNNLIGGLVYYFVISKVETIDHAMRIKLYVPLLVLIMLASSMFMWMQDKVKAKVPETLANTMQQEVIQVEPADHQPQESDNDSDAQSTSSKLEKENKPGSWQVFIYTFKILRRLDVLGIAFISLQTGLVLTFSAGLYSTCISHTQALSSRPKSMAGLAMISIGLGGISSGLLNPLSRWLTNAHAQFSLWLISAVAVFVMFINFPNDAPMHASPGWGYIKPNMFFALLGAYSFGFLDGGWNIQACSLIGRRFSNNIDGGLDQAAVFSLNKLMQSLGGAIGFAYSSYLSLYWQLGILFVASTLAVTMIIFIEWATVSQEPSEAEVSFLDSTQTSGNSTDDDENARNEIESSGRNHLSA